MTTPRKTPSKTRRLDREIELLTTLLDDGRQLLRFSNEPKDRPGIKARIAELAADLKAARLERSWL